MRRLLAGAGLFLAAAPSVAFAHTGLASSDPEDRTVHARMPDAVVLTFSGELSAEGSGFEVTDPAGSVIGTGSLDLDVADRNVLRSSVTSDATGVFTIAWHSVALDGHEAAGELTFSVEAPVQPPSPDTAVRAAGNRSPSLALGVLLLVVGAAVAARRRLARLLGIASGALVLAACIPGASPCPSAEPVIDVVVTTTSMAPANLDACRGQQVTLRVAAEADGVFHIHGYDEAVPATTVVAGETTEITFAADRSGQFPIEFHAGDDPQGVRIGILTINDP